MKLIIYKFLNKIPDFLRLFLIWRFCLFIISYLAYLKIPHFSNIFFYNNLNPIITSWLIFDSTWFLKISQLGYFDIKSTAFFPLWPLVIFNISKILYFIDYRIVGFIVANVMSLLACWLFYDIVKSDYNEKIAYRSLKYFLFFPMSVFLGTAYSEPLFLLMTLLSFYFLKRKNYFFSGMCVLYASLTKPFGILLAIPLIIEAKLKAKKIFDFKWLFLFLSLLGPVIYSLYLKISFDDPFIFLRAQNSPEWKAKIGLGSFIKLWQDIKILLSFQLLKYNYIEAIMTSGLFIFILAVLILNRNKIKPAFFIYSLIILLLTLFTNSLSSFGRYALLIFPFFIILGILGKNKQFDEFITILFLLLLGFYTSYFIVGGFIG
ncbi:MAG: mannosyltransferase family protein [Patescibacteria group bacterium]|jgi:hypothetical protein